VPKPSDGGDADVRARSKVFVRDLLEAMREIALPLNVVLLANPANSKTYYNDLITSAIDAFADVLRANLPLWRHETVDVDVIVRTRDSKRRTPPHRGGARPSELLRAAY
jgi:hypothetical protein